MSDCNLTGWQRFKSRWLWSTKHDLKEMESRLKEAIAKTANISPAVESAAMKAQAALDALDATIPDK